MITFTYRPEGADERSWDLDFDTMKASEWIAIEKQAGFTSVELAQALQKGSFLAIKALLWLLLKRDMSTVPWDSVEFSMSEIDIVDDEDEPVEPDPKASLLADAATSSPLGTSSTTPLETLTT